jgi:DNA repair protein RadC
MTSGEAGEEVKHYHGHRERLRARLREAGPAALADYELLELVLFRALPQRDVKPLAKALLARFGSFQETISADPHRLAEVKGMGPSAIAEFKIVEAAAQRFAKGAVKKRLPMGSWTEVVDYAARRWRSKTAKSSASCFSTRTRGSRSPPFAYVH